ncbi:MAG: hypothetical protein AAF922_04500 [Pseudomonadota bacterium]
MSENTPPSQTPVGLYGAQRQDGFTLIDIIASVVSIGWLVVTGAFFLFFAEPAETGGSAYQVAIVLIAVFLPAFLVWVAAASAKSGQIMREESLHLQNAAALIRQTTLAQAQPKMLERANALSTDDVEEVTSADPKPSRPDPTLVPFSSSRNIEPASVAQWNEPTAIALETEQPGLPFELQSDVVHPPLSTADFIQALNFPETAEDKAGFDALRRALRHREAAQIIQASQDVLTLLSQDGIYMDDLTPDMAHPDLWRRFAAGERGRQIAALGGIRDRSSLALSAARIKQDTIFRDASHHFLRLYDRMIHRFCEVADDGDVSALSDTRTSRAFMLLGRVAGTFD